MSRSLKNDQRSIESPDASLTQTHVRYLLALSSLNGEANKGARVTDLSEELGVSKPSVHRMMRRLSEMGLAASTPRGKVYLTVHGHDVVKHSSARMEKVIGALQSCLKLTEERARKAALALLEYLPDDETLETCSG